MSCRYCGGDSCGSNGAGGGACVENERRLPAVLVSRAQPLPSCAAGGAVGKEGS